MSVPKHSDMYKEILLCLADNKEHKLSDIRNFIADVFKVTSEERKLLLPSGKQTLFNNRVQWSCVYLKQAGLIINISRGMYRLTDLGIKVLKKNPMVVNNEFLMQFDTFKEFVAPNAPNNKNVRNNESADIDINSNQTPQDILDAAYVKINDDLIQDLISLIMKQTPVFFEHLVVRLLVKMGYGGSLENAGTITKATGDDGIDGIIREDKLGFNNIYIQAKRWDCSSNVGRPELQKFVGALAGQGASKGLFITTAGFTKEAREYAERQHSTKIVLVDGKMLARLMIEYDMGVSTEIQYTIKKVDTDFFDDDMY